MKARSTTKAKKKPCHIAGHPDHRDELQRLRRAEGQVQGIQRMIEERRYCVDILQQLRAASAALKNVEASILKTHLRACLKDALVSKDAFDADKKIQEISDLLSR